MSEKERFISFYYSWDCPEGLFALELGWGVSLALSKPGPVAISLMAQKTPCPNLKKNTVFN